MSVQLITHDYPYEVTKETLPVVVEFYAGWCPKCAMMKEVTERLAKRLAGTCIFKKVDIDQDAPTAEELGVEIVPTFVVYKNGEIMGYTTGILSEETLEHRILELIET